MNQKTNPVEALLAMRTKNLSFFERVYPGIFQYFSTYEMKRSKLDILPEMQEVDLIEGGQHVYKGARQYAPREVDHFLDTYDYGKKVHSIRPLFKGDYKNPRFFAQKVESVYQSSPLKEEDYRGYTIPDFFPIMVFMGCGLGLHVTEFCAKRDVHHVCVVETNLDRFMASLYITDWESLVTPYLTDEERSFHFILLPDGCTEVQMRDVVWNHLIEYCPIFPVMTLFYNHLGSPVYDKLIDAINADLYVHLFSFGNYDDEVNQLNNAIHNFKQGVKCIPLPKPEGFDLPVFIVGSGPSLDERIDWIKRGRSNALIISCGTALRALCLHGIKPDIHVELESDFRTYETLNLIEDKAYLRSISILGAAQLNPLMFSLFGEARLFFKGEGVLKGLFANSGESVKEAAPTCTNAALAIAFHFGFSRIYLFGLDYGFPDKESHHAKGSIYYKEGVPDGLKQVTRLIDSDLIKVDAANGGTIVTTNLLYASKRRTENMILAAQHPHIYNCSNGSLISNTQWLSNTEDFLAQIPANSIDKKEVIHYLFDNNAKSISREEVALKTEYFAGLLEGFVRYVSQIISLPIKSLAEFATVCYRINDYLQRDLKVNHESFYYFIRGSVWHFLHAGFSHVNAIEAEAEQQKFIASWITKLQSFLSGLLAHYQSVVEKDFLLENDPFVSRSISQAENNDALKALEWLFLGVLVDDHGRYFAAR